MTDENPDKDALKEAWVEGYKMGKHVGDVDPTSIKAAKREFEQWWARNE
jgi:hypothetical protein